MLWKQRHDSKPGVSGSAGAVFSVGTPFAMGFGLFHIAILVYAQKCRITQ